MNNNNHLLEKSHAHWELHRSHSEQHKCADHVCRYQCHQWSLEQTVNAGATPGNFQMSYNFQHPADSQFDMHYSIPGQQTHFTAAAIIDQPGGGTVTCTPSGAGPGQHHVTFNVSGTAPNFTILFTFN